MTTTTTRTTRPAKKETRQAADESVVRPARRLSLPWGAALLLPFVLVVSVPRWAVPAYGDWIARRAASMASLARWLHPAPPSPPKIEDDVTDPERPPSREPPHAGSVAAPRPQAAPVRAAHSRVEGGAVAPSPAGGPIHVPAAAVQRAIDDDGKNIRGRTTRGPDGKPAGVRLTGVSSAGVGLRDGDVIVAVDGRPTMDEDSATDQALAVIARGESVLRCKLLRGDQTLDVTVDLPLAPASGEAR
jgi:hypothetical protein